MLAGRDPERAAIAALLDAARTGSGGALVVRGVAGAGKSTLLTDAVARADATVLRTSGVESESPLAFAALQRLLWPLRARLDVLPGPQRAALRAALGEAEGEGDRFLAFLGTLSLLADAAEEAPVLAVVDDAHWLDEASAAALLFVARRLQAERVALLFASRDGDVRRFDAPDLRTVVLGGVAGADADALLSARAGAAIDPAVRDRLVRATGGNPLALGELAGALTGDQLAGRAPLPAQLPLTGGVERAFLDRFRRLDEFAQRFLLLAAADDTGRLTVVRDAAERLGVGEEALDAVERAGLLHVDGDAVDLYHPLVRSAVYRAATSAQRRAAHRALADALGTDPDRRAWHLSAAADRPDEQVVAALDGVAERATGRGGHEAASSAWARAAELTVDPAARSRRLAAAAYAAWLAAQPSRARSLADAARALATDPLLRADLDRLRARVEWNVGSPLVGHRILLQAAAEVAAVDVDRARAMTMLAAAVSSVADEGAEDMSEHIAGLGDPSAAEDDRARCYARLLSGFVHLRHGRLSEAAAQFHPALEFDPGDDTDLRSNLGVAAFQFGDTGMVLTHHARLLADARSSGALVLIVYALTRRAFAEMATGDWRAATAGAAEALDLATSSGQPALTRFPHGWLALLAALRDQREDLAAHLEALDRQPGAGVTGPLVDDLARWARALTADTPASALHQLEQASTAIVRRLAAVDRLEAAVRADRPELARTWADELEEFGTAVDADWARAVAAYGRALLADGADAEAEFHQAIKHADAGGHRFDRARIHLGYGEHLRRARRRVDARTHLRDALEVFEDLGAARWATRAATELRASGETARRRDVTTATDLTAQERQVAALVRQGLSNRDVAARLFVSPRTVDFHLRNVFSKLGVASRAELTALPLD
ncbi:ATP-binding protein [Geodermatophilus marinus]|uniref:ATP-binding protein n=1 Tax=Geodermatophilus sp. LHW52908 TaxID=2303986 RepID=UPI000E3DAB5F|nr:helix-turn-helix transcriptional regulator [Geodermatophilus sp. LHW52908]RFU21843.1 helix-turn-helix transcriptional regulator [Geodermatophilus sp. LHW52908]